MPQSFGLLDRSRHVGRRASRPTFGGNAVTGTRPARRAAAADRLTGVWEWISTGRGKAVVSVAYLASFVASGLIFGWGTRGMVAGPLLVTAVLVALTVVDPRRLIRSAPGGDEPSAAATPEPVAAVDRISRTRHGYDVDAVDALLKRALAALESSDPELRAEMARSLESIEFPIRNRGYDP